MKAIVIGAGIAGLAAAKGLQRIGWEVAVYEQAPLLKPLGAGLVLSANALKALRALGVLEEALKIGQSLNHFLILNKKGKILADTNHLLLSQRWGIQSCISLHRGELQQLLLESIHPLQVQTGKRCKALVQDEQGVKVTFEDGSSDRADLLIGCDGIHSAVRHSAVNEQLAPQAKKRYAGYTCWRGITSQQPAGLHQQQATESWGSGNRFGIVPLTNNRVYWFACLNAAQPQDPAMKAMGMQELQKHFNDFHKPVQELLQLTPPEALIWGDIIDLEPLSTYTFGRVVLVGDAAHATTPNMGQGACQALEGTAVLMALLARLPLQEALKEYNRQRVPRASGIVKQSWQVGKIAQLANPAGVWLRDHLFPLIPQSVNNRPLEALLGIELADIPLAGKPASVIQESQ